MEPTWAAKPNSASSGALNSTIQNIRQKGFEEVVGAHRASRWLALSTGGTCRTTRCAAAENLITANPDLTAIYATGEPALLGAVAAIESQGKQVRSSSSAGI